MKSISEIEILNARGWANELSAVEYAALRVEMTRRELMKLNASVELCTEYGARLSEIVCSAINEVEALAEEIRETESQ